MESSHHRDGLRRPGLAERARSQPEAEPDSDFNSRSRPPSKTQQQPTPDCSSRAIRRRLWGTKQPRGIGAASRTNVSQRAWGMSRRWRKPINPGHSFERSVALRGFRRNVPARSSRRNISTALATGRGWAKRAENHAFGEGGRDHGPRSAGDSCASPQFLPSCFHKAAVVSERKERLV